MTQSSRLAAHRARASSAETEQEIPPASPPPVAPADTKEEDPNNPAKEKLMPTEDEMKAAVSAAEQKGREEATQAATQRMTTVFASEHYAGRETLAAKLLGKSLSAEDVIDLLADAPKTAPVALTTEQIAAASEAAELAAREEMKTTLAETGNSDIDATGKPGGEAQVNAKTEADKVWGYAHGVNK